MSTTASATSTTPTVTTATETTTTSTVTATSVATTVAAATPIVTAIVNDDAFWMEQWADGLAEYFATRHMHRLRDSDVDNRPRSPLAREDDIPIEWRYPFCESDKENDADVTASTEAPSEDDDNNE
jgi:hypothetical protein